MAAGPCVAWAGVAGVALVSLLVGLLQGRGGMPPAAPVCRAEEVVITPTATERLQGRLSDDSLARAVRCFARCGAVAVSGAVSDGSVLRQFERAVHESLEQPLASRAQARTAVRAAVARAEGGPPVWDSLWADPSVRAERFFELGEVLRERHDGRLDLMLPHHHPFNSSKFCLNRFVLPILARILGGDGHGGGTFELKSVHAVVSLPGTRAQGWHRDDAPLFGPTAPTPTYAVNAFLALDDVPLEAGPTEVLLGSHARGNDAVDELLLANFTSVAFELPRGSLLLTDYRLVHRGGANTRATPRVLGMLVFGRSWWRDAVNYWPDNYGGAERALAAVPVDGHGQPYAPADAEAVVARRSLHHRDRGDASRTAGLDDARLMFRWCAELWTEAHGGGNPAPS